MIPLPNGENYFYVSSKGIVYSIVVLKKKNPAEHNHICSRKYLYYYLISRFFLLM